jgi:hypothetical protein
MTLGISGCELFAAAANIFAPLVHTFADPCGNSAVTRGMIDAWTITGGSYVRLG